MSKTTSRSIPRKKSAPKTGYNRQSQDVGNILSLEHVNVTVPDQSLATLFYVNGLGLTRDPFVDFGPVNVWINAGEQQFHLPTRAPQVLRGHVGLVLPSLADLERRLHRVSSGLEGTRFAYKTRKSRVDVTCPWGNEIRCYEPGDFGSLALGIPYVELNVPAGSTNGIMRFYSEIMGAPAACSNGTCNVSIGTGQSLRFREQKKALPEYDQHHIAVYVSDFSGPYSRLLDRGLITEESDEHQYRFQQIIDPEDGSVMFELEHEIRSLHHPMFARHLTNRNPSQTFANYHKGRDAFVP